MRGDGVQENIPGPSNQPAHVAAATASTGFDAMMNRALEARGIPHTAREDVLVRLRKRKDALRAIDGL